MPHSPRKSGLQRVWTRPPPGLTVSRATRTGVTSPTVRPKDPNPASHFSGGTRCKTFLSQVTSLALVSAGLTAVMVTSPAGAAGSQADNRTLVEECARRGQRQVPISREAATGEGRHRHGRPRRRRRLRDVLAAPPTPPLPLPLPPPLPPPLPSPPPPFRAHLDKQGDLTSVNGYAAPDLTLSVSRGSPLPRPASVPSRPSRRTRRPQRRRHRPPASAPPPAT